MWSQGQAAEVVNRIERPICMLGGGPGACAGRLSHADPSSEHLLQVCNRASHERQESGSDTEVRPALLRSGVLRSTAESL